MSDDERKSGKDDSALNGKKDQSTEEEEEYMGEEEEGIEEEENGSNDLEGEYIEEEENGSTEVEGESVEEEENGSTLNGNTSFEDDLSPIEEEGSSMEEGSPPTVKESPTVEEKRPTVEVEYVNILNPHPPFIVNYLALDENPPFEMGSAIMRDDPAIEAEYLAILRDLPVVEEKQPEEEQRAPAEKECQTIELEVAYQEVAPIEEGYEAITKEPSSTGLEGFYDKGCQTTSTALNRPEPIDREIQTTLRVGRSFSSSSLNASMGGDSGNSLKECPSIEEEPPPEPIEGELLQVRAQVMVRNDSTGGWVPEGCGGMSTVTISKIETPRKPGDDSKVVNTYVIRGKRLSDQKVTLTCTIVKDFEYNKVMPTFHHWKSGNEKFGLTFQTTTEARIFDKGLRDAVFTYMLELDPNAVPLKIDGDDDDDFLAFTKPAEPRPRTPSPEVVYELPDYLLPNAEEEERIQFMQLTNLPEYFYKDYRTHNHKADNKLRRRPLHRTRKPLKYFGLIRRTTRLRCKYCHELYEEEENTKGQCRYAPDCVKKVIDELTCMRCAKLFVHDCMMDPDEDYSHPCTCRDDGYCGLRWAGLCLLSLLLPCMLFYPPMKGCYDCGVHCGVCGGRHEEKIVRRVEHII